jgi:hypothetical protein
LFEFYPIDWILAASDAAFESTSTELNAPNLILLFYLSLMNALAEKSLPTDELGGSYLLSSFFTNP